MQKPFAFLAATFLVLVALVVLPSPGAGASHHSANMFGFFFDDPVVTAIPPKGTTDKVRNVCVPTCNPQTTSATFTAMADNGLGAIAYGPTSDILFTVWLSSGGADLPLRGLNFGITNAKAGAGEHTTCTTDRLVRESNGDVLVLTDEPQRISIPCKRPGGFTKDALIGLRIQVMTVGNDTADVAVLLHYGSAAHPSGVVFTINQPVPANKVVGGGLLRFQLAENGFTSTLPTNRGNAKSRDVAGGVDDYVKTTWFATPPKADKAYTFVTDTVFNITFFYPGVPQDAAELIDYRVDFIIKEKVLSSIGQFTSGGTPVLSNCATAACGAVNGVVALPTKGQKINASDALQIEFFVKSASAKGVDYQVRFGAIEAPTGMIAAVAEGSGGSGGGGGSSGSSSSTPTTSASSNATSNATTASTASSPASTTTSSAATNATNSTDSAGSEKDVGNPAQVLPNVTFAVALAGAAMALAWFGRRRSP